MGTQTDKQWVQPTDESVSKGRAFDANRSRLSSILLGHPSFLAVLGDIAKTATENRDGFKTLDVCVDQVKPTFDWDFDNVYLEFTRKGNGLGKWSSPKLNNPVVAWKYNVTSNCLEDEELVGDFEISPCRYMNLIRRIDLNTLQVIL